MKCQNCGSNLNIEDKYCPFCGEPNPYAKRHQQEMDRYAKDYEKTRQDVLENTSRLNRRSVRITIIAILAALIAIAAFVLAQADNIRYWQEDRAIAAHADEYREVIEQYMEDRDYIGLYYYMSKNHLTYTRDLDEYSAVYDMSMYYKSIHSNLQTLWVKKSFPEKYTYVKESEVFEYIARDIEGLNEAIKPGDYRPERHEGNKMEYMEDLRDDAEALISGTFNVSIEDVRALREMNKSRIYVYLEDNYDEEE